MKHIHQFAPLNDHAVYCAGCGKINAVPHEYHHACAPCTLPHYWVTTTPTYYPWLVTSGTTTIVDDLAASSTYTVRNT